MHMVSIAEFMGHDKLQAEAEALIEAEGLGESYARIMAIFREVRARRSAASRIDWGKVPAWAREADGDDLPDR